MSQSYLFKRFIYMLICLFVVATLVFLMFRLIPGNPVGALVDPGLDAEAIEMLEKKFGLDKPLHEQYFLYMKNLMEGDFGTSFFYRKPVAELIGDRILNTVILAVVSLTAAYALGILLGVWIAWRRGSKSEMGVILVSLFFRSAPIFWVGMLVIMLFSYKLGWFPNAGMRTPGYEASSLFAKYFSLDFLHHLICRLPFILYTI